MMLGQYLEVTKETLPRRRTPIYLIFNRSQGSCVATIRWYGRWRQYCYFPEGDTVLSASCMEDILGFLRTLNRTKTPWVDQPMETLG